MVVYSTAHPSEYSLVPLPPVSLTPQGVTVAPHPARLPRKTLQDHQLITQQLAYEDFWRNMLSLGNIDTEMKK